MTASSMPMAGARVWVTRPRDAADAIITYFAVEAARILKGAVHGGA